MNWPQRSRPHSALFLDQRPAEQRSAWQRVMWVPSANGTFFFYPPRVAGQGGSAGVFPAVALGVLIAHRGADSGAMAEEQRDLMSDRGSGVLSLGDTQRCWGHGVYGRGCGEG